MNIMARSENKHLVGQGHEYECVSMTSQKTMGRFVCRNCHYEMEGLIRRLEDSATTVPENAVIFYHALHFRRKDRYEWTTRELDCPYRPRREPISFAISDMVRGPSLTDQTIKNRRITMIEDTGRFAMATDALGHIDCIRLDDVVEVEE